MEHFRSKIEMSSFVKQNGKLVQAQHCRGRLQDPKYIEGSLRIVVNDKVFLDESVEDLIDQLWEYLLNLIEEIDENGEGEFSFPDQPLQFTAKLDARRQLLSIHLGEPFLRRQLVTWLEFREAVCTHANEFFHLLFKIDSRVMTSVQQRIEALRRRG